MRRALAILLVVLAAALAGACGDEATVVNPAAPSPGPGVSAAPVLTYFYSDLPGVNYNQPCTAIRWDVQGDPGTRVRIEPTIGDGLPTNGFRTVCPAVGTTYTLTATDPQGRRATGTTTVLLLTSW